jgi:hypothetical protein
VRRQEAERCTWFEGFAAHKLGIADLNIGLSDFEIRRQRIRAKIISSNLQDVAPGAPHDLRTWSQLYAAVYGRDLTAATTCADDPRRQGDTRGNV